MKKVISLILSMTMLISVTAGLDLTALAGEIRSFSVDMTYGQTEARTILDMINELRTGDDAWYWNSDDTTETTLTNLSELTYDYDLEKIAMQRAAEIAIYYSHTRPNGERCFTAYDDAGYSSGVRGENIAYGYNALTTAESVHDAWSEADENYSGQGHRRNMLDSDYKAVGVGHIYYNGRHYWVEEFSGTVNNAEATTANDSLTSCTITADMDLISHTYEYNYTKEATCTEQGYYESKTCTQCGYTVSETGYTSALGHTYTSSVTAPTCTKQGYTTYTCKTCGYSYVDNYVSATSHSFGKNAQYCTVCGAVNPNYITSATANAVTTTTTTASSTSTATASVSTPKKTSVKKTTSPKKKQIKVTWKKVSGVTGYQVQYATNKKFTKNKKTVTVKGAGKTSKTIKKLKSKKTYYVRVRTYKTVNGKKVYSKWSTVKKVTVK